MRKFFRVLGKIHNFWEEDNNGGNVLLGFLAATFMGVMLAAFSVFPFTPMPLVSWVLLAAGFSLIFVVIVATIFGKRGVGSILLPTFGVFFGANAMMLLEGRRLALIPLVLFLIFFIDEFSSFWKRDTGPSVPKQTPTTPAS